ncbi:ribosome biogenesis protein SPATA5 [Uranotaenia lowii]|uniref:ribosome biogenesis protein SPATA5 n=1 Tax=Uranotaenia lowii TaxID=190385 RepID=UPI00247AA013|nr:ribosome biogenesis protein SPATA5 [Uranotaenia lowii]
MPSKPLKKEKMCWWTCENCKILLLSIELAKHRADQCRNQEELSGYVTATNVFVTNIIENKIPEDWLNVDEAHMNGFVLLSETIMSRLNLILGDLVQLKSYSEDNGFIRRAWPMDDKNGACVFVPDAYSSLTSSISLRAVKCRIPAADKITLKQLNISNEPTDLRNRSSVLKIVKKHYLNKIVSVKTCLSIKLCNKLYSFQIIFLDCRKKSNATIVDQVSNLSLFDGYYEIDSSTKLELQPENVKLNLHITNDLKNIGGLDHVITQVKQLASIAIGISLNSKLVPISRGLLVYGTSGVGKTMLLSSIANYFHCQVIKILAAEIYSKYYGESENNISNIVSKASKNYPDPTIIIVEDLQNVCPKVETSDICKRISGSFVNMMDNIHSLKACSRTLIVASADNLDNINPVLRRSGRFDYEFEIPVPNSRQREEILVKILHTYDNKLLPQDITKLSRITNGYVGADLMSLVSHAANTADTVLDIDALTAALRNVKASAMKEIMMECPNVFWNDVGGQNDLKLKLMQIIEWPINRPELFARLGITAPRGLLMFGPPGCSKTMIAKAIATECKLNFLSIKGSELFSMWVGESERAVKDLFRKARQVAPAIIFFDEIDAIGGERAAESGSSVKERVLAQLLTEIDGVSALQNVKIIAATNRPDLIDKALMRPGRLDRIIYVRLPDAITRAEIFRLKLSKIPIADDVSIDELVTGTEGYSGSEIEAICQEATIKALEDSFEVTKISKLYFEYALNIVQPRTSVHLLELYEGYMKKINN